MARDIEYRRRPHRRSKLMTSYLAILLSVIAACGGSEGGVSGSENEGYDRTSSPTTNSPFADSEAACQLLTEEEILDLTSAATVSRWLSSDQTSCLYGMIGPAGYEIVTITVAIPSEINAFDVILECATSAWGEEGLIELGMGENAFGVEFPTGGALVHLQNGDVILGVGVISSRHSPGEAFGTAIEIAQIADEAVASNEMALGDGRNWPPPGCR